MNLARIINAFSHLNSTYIGMLFSFQLSQIIFGQIVTKMLLMRIQENKFKQVFVKGRRRSIIATSSEYNLENFVTLESHSLIYPPTKRLCFLFKMLGWWYNRCVYWRDSKLSSGNRFRYFFFCSWKGKHKYKLWAFFSCLCQFSVTIKSMNNKCDWKLVFNLAPFVPVAVIMAFDIRSGNIFNHHSINFLFRPSTPHFKIQFTTEIDCIFIQLEICIC